MQYVGQTCRALQKRFGEHYRRMKMPKPIDTFLYQHFKLSGNSPNDVLLQPVGKLTYDKNSSSRFKIIKRHETELKWIKLLQTPFPLGFNDNIYHEGNISKMPDFDVFSLFEIRKRKSRSHGIRRKGNSKQKKRAVKRSNTSLKDLSKVWSWSTLYAFFFPYLFQYYVFYILRLINSMIGITNCTILRS